MNCKFCGRVLPDEKTGKRPREYCDDACKQKAYRRRHGGNPPASEIRGQLQEARLRIRQLEQLVSTSGITLPRREQEISPIEVHEFANSHSVAWTDVERNLTMGMLKTITIRGEECLDAHGQRVFWELNHDYKKGVWRACPDCPHDYS
jgi:hypothetical protein